MNKCENEHDAEKEQHEIHTLKKFLEISGISDSPIKLSPPEPDFKLSAQNIGIELTQAAKDSIEPTNEMRAFNLLHAANRLYIDNGGVYSAHVWIKHQAYPDLVKIKEKERKKLIEDLVNFALLAKSEGEQQIESDLPLFRFVHSVDFLRPRTLFGHILLRRD